MKKIKFFVSMILYLSGLLAYTTEYCKKCPEHTLCMYKESGPSPHCIGYDAQALLTEDDSNAILDKINERRNFVATGRSRLLPAAADMKKIVWSAELASFAQRWADQCDQSLRPDRKDKCRDMEYLEVGQNIASITGPSSSYNVKSFVEIWFMKSLVYTGSVTYYDQSRDHNTNDFTQLIWAETDKVGCGKAKFFVKNGKPIIVDRLVCNFAPKANVHGKPVYTIGYPATQCDNGMERDKNFPGLCSHRLKRKDTLPSSNSPATSLLRIRNLFNNDSTRKAIDPIFNNVKPMTKVFNIMGYHSQQVTVQTQNNVNNSSDAIKRSYPFQNEKIWGNEQMDNSTRHHYGDYLQKREKGHSRLYHGHDHKNEFDYLHPETMNQNARRYDYKPTTALNLYMEQDHRKHNIEQKCTRKTERKLTDNEGTECAPCKTNLNKCTRGQKTTCPRNNACQLSTRKCDQDSRIHSTLREFYACDSFSPAYQPNPYRCAHNTNCDCVDLDYPTKPCPHMLRTIRDMFNEKLEKQGDFQYYDLLPNTGQQSTNRPILKDLYRAREIFDDDSWLPNSKNLDRRKQLKRNNRGRKTRAEEDGSFRPFWQVDEYANKNQPELKSIRYTTLSNKKSLKNKRTRKQSKSTMKTESITVAYKKLTSNNKRVTEKYLSFDELMHLRKHNANDSGGRRNFDDKDILREADTTTTTVSEITTTEATPEYSFNTPYIRMKYCTRKLTCTWTAASLTDSAGSIIGGGGNAIGGSRTPPGYVEGCTRTSTCTRDYMHRNKMATLPVETTSPEPDPGDDEDYCERRSLNRRSNNNNLIADNKTKSFTEYFSGQYESNKFKNNCICFDTNMRNKRQSYFCNNSLKDKNQKREIKRPMKYETDLLSYGDLYYYVVSKIIEMWKVTKSSYSHDEYCICNGISKLTRCNLLVLVLNYFITLL